MLAINKIKMDVLDQIQAALLPEYESKFDALKKIAFELHQLGERELEKAVVKRMAGLLITGE